MKNKLLAIALLSAFAAPAFAADNAGQFYVTGDFGPISFSNSSGHYSNTLGDFPNPNALRIGGGYHYNSMLAIEADYALIGGSTLSWSGGSLTTKNSALQFAAVGSYPVSTSIDVIGKLGISMNSSKLSGTGTASGYDSSTSSTALMYGIGAQYHLSQAVDIRALYEDFGKHNTDDGPIPPVRAWDVGTTMFSLGVAYNF